MSEKLIICTECRANRFIGTWLQAYQKGWAYIKEDSKESTICPSCIENSVSKAVIGYCGSCKTDVVLTKDGFCVHCGRQSSLLAII